MIYVRIDFHLETAYNPFMTKYDYPIGQTKQPVPIDTYIQNVNKLFLHGKATEHSYRSDLQVLLSGLLPDCQVTNEPKRIDCGAPDYIITHKEIPVGYIEAKDIGLDLTGKNLQEQFDRYKAALDNLIFTDYLAFRFYQKAAFVAEIRIGTIENGHIKPLPENFEQFTLMIKSFAERISQSIKSPQKLAEMMANKAKMLANIIAGALKSDNKNQEDSSLKDQMVAFQKLLIHDIKADDFADIYAQTIAYGMFAARYHDPTLVDFSRQEAATLIPKSNPFLRKLFQYIAGYDIDDRIVWVVDELVNIFLATDVAEIMSNFGKSTKMEDPVIHFYETFLAAYNPALRKARGVWYTPQPVVNFIVRAIDDILKSEFGLPQGLTDTSLVTIPSSQGGVKHVHKVQILDPATGTGTFLAEVIRHIYKKFEGQQGVWSKYVSDHLIPRLNGFELLMASYAMAHLKLEMLLRDSGYSVNNNKRLRIYLTNSLEEHHPDTGTLFASWLSNEATEANYVKRDTPVMVVLGNPPYSGHSSNKGEWIEELLKDYKQEPGGGKLKERNPKWLNDDYVKFIRYGQHFIEKKGEGILAYINNHSFLDNPTFRGMRWNLQKTFDKIYILDLHGNSKKKETCPDGSPDKNVFDITQGVSINLFVKTGEKKPKDLVRIMHFDLYGNRNAKYQYLWEHDLGQVEFEELKMNAPQYLFVRKDFEKMKRYEDGFKISELMNTNVLGFQTHRDKFAISFERNEMFKRIEEMLDCNISDAEYSKKYKLTDSSGWRISLAREKLKCSKEWKNDIITCAYRPFDIRYCYFSDVAMDRTRVELKTHVQGRENLCLNIVRQTKMDNWGHVLISKMPTPALFVEIKDGSNVFPLYLYPNKSNQQNLIPRTSVRKPNLNPEVIEQIADRLDLRFTPEKEEVDDAFAPIDLLDYIYAVLHSPGYRETYKEFLKIDFPRVPYPGNKDTFWQLVELGGELRQIHLLESPAVEQYISNYPADGDNVVTRPIGKKDFEITNIHTQFGRVWINDDQYFDGIPKTAWEFYIGGYKPAQKWLKDRKDRILDYNDIFHYHKIIVALTETSRIMKAIDKILKKKVPDRSNSFPSFSAFS